MRARYFTLEEANTLLADIEPAMARLLDYRAKVVGAREDVAELFRSGRSDIGGSQASALVKDFLAIDRLVRRIRSHGCLLKDLNSGLVDFLSLRDGREVYLCWRFGEPRIQYYHELHTGFQGRQPV